MLLNPNVTTDAVPNTTDLSIGAGPAMRTGAVTLRRYHPRDRPAVAAMSAALSPETLYQRFFTGYPVLPAAFLDRLDLGLERPSMVLLAVRHTLVLGVGELIVTDSSPLRAEIGLLLRDTHRRQGIGMRLVESLVVHARLRGVVTVAADVLSENRAIEELIRTRYPTARAVPSGTTTRYELDLHPAAHGSGTAGS